MHGRSRVLLALATAITSVPIALAQPASAASPCTDTASSPRTSSANHDMDMSHDDMDMGSTKTKENKAMDHNCPTVVGAREIAVTGDAFTFTPSSVNLTAGEDITIALSADDIAHDFYVKGVGHIVHAKAGKTAMGGLRIDKPGTYPFWCTVKGHKKSGMTGTITVT